MVRRNVASGSDGPVPESDIRALEVVLYRFALRATRDPALSRDLTQDALVAALADAASFAGRSSVRTWVIGILVHKLTDHRRRSRVRNEDGNDESLLAAPSAEDVERVVEARQRLAAVERGLRALPERERLAVLLLDGEELDRTEACNALGVSATHLRVLLHRGRNRLRRMLEEDGH
jgi:RNA polymerase sigma factor (sigma-70 family)